MVGMRLAAREPVPTLQVPTGSRMPPTSLELQLAAGQSLLEAGLGVGGDVGIVRQDQRLQALSLASGSTHASVRRFDPRWSHWSCWSGSSPGKPLSVIDSLSRFNHLSDVS